MHRALAVAHFVIAILLIPVSLFPITLAPIMLLGPAWVILLARRLWRRDPTVIATLRRTHLVFLAIDALLIWYGIWMLKAAVGGPGPDSARAWNCSRLVLRRDPLPYAPRAAGVMIRAWTRNW
jgi:hypothetical protein